MRMRALFRVGFRLTAVSGFANFFAALLGVQGGWVDWALSLMFLGGVADMIIAAGFTALSSPGDRSLFAIEIDDGGVKAWWGDDARERREEYLEARERGTSRKALHAGPDSAMRWAYPAGLSYRVPWADPGVSLREADQGWRALSALGPPQKRLAPPLSPSWRDQGVDFPGQPAYSNYDRLGRPQPPFPIHFKTLEASETLTHGVRMSHSVSETHSDPDHEGCPVCDIWRRDAGR